MSRESPWFDPQRPGEDPLGPEREPSNETHPPDWRWAPHGPEISSLDAREPIALKPEREDSPRAHLLRDHTFLLRESQLLTMTELGKFRVVAASDLARFAYASDNARMERDLRRLTEQGLVSQRTLATSGRKSLRVLTLTKTGKRLLHNTRRVSEHQRLYHGIVKPREAKHDAELYRLFQAEAARIENAGGKPLRVLLDYELQRDLNRDRAALGNQEKDPQEVERLAERHGLVVVDGKIPLPDMRIEYQTAELELDQVDLELATRHYRPRGVAEKAKAGFSLYSHQEDAARLRRILYDQKLTARIRTL
jgi:DNA-binding PadR family transcriptional regulator